MIRLFLLLSAIIAVELLVSAEASAQVPAQRGMPSSLGPTVSPYLNLLRPGNATALNYYGLVRPQLDTISGFQSVQQRFTQLNSDNQANAGPLADSLSTGHGASFMNYKSYFMTTNVGAGGSSTATPARSQTTTNTPRSGKR